MGLSRRRFLGTTGLGWAAAAAARRTMAADHEPGRNVVLVVSDGLRWQEVFRGAEAELLDGQGAKLDNKAKTKAAFWRDTPELRRQALFPFLWETVAAQGWLTGNRDRGEAARVSNDKHFSYPGYSEMLCGRADPRIDSNAKRPNPNVTVFEWLNGRPGLAGRVAAYGSWDVFPSIFNAERSGLPVTAGWAPLRGPQLTERQVLLNELLARTAPMWEGVCYDAFTFAEALEALKAGSPPRVLFIGLGETDEFAHEGRYDRYLESARRFDGMLRTLWETLQAMPVYRDRTDLVVTADHGRGAAGAAWQSHGADVPGADEIWVGMLGPGAATRPQGEITLARVAATVAAAVGEDFAAAVPGVAPSLCPVAR